MPIRWTAEKDQNFLMLIIEAVKVDYKTLAAKWAERYPDEDKPTPKALEEHIGSLKRKAKAANGGKAVSTPRSNSKTTAAPKSTPSSKRAAPKTPSSSAKRQKRQAMSDEDDSEDERNMTLYVPKREVISRRGKSKSYAESDDEGGDGLDDIPFTSAQPEQHPATNSSGSVLDTPSDPAAKNTETDSVLGTNGGLGNRGSGPKSKEIQPKPKYDYFSKEAGDDSDNSDFNPVG